jgi:hypothetical protein
MSVRIMDRDDGAVLYFSTSMWAFGPVFEDVHQAKRFLEWMRSECDPRTMSDSTLDRVYIDFLKEQESNHDPR